MGIIAFLSKNNYKLHNFKTTNSITKNIIAISIGVLPIHIWMIWYRLTQTEGFTTNDLIIYPLLFGGASILLILALNKYYLKQPLSVFNPGEGNWWKDILVGLALTAIIFLMVAIERQTLLHWLPRAAPPSDEIFELMRRLSESPGLLFLYYGLVLVIGIAIFEEVTRVFLLNNLWAISKNKNWEITAILLTSILIGVVHLYQGWFGIVSIGLKSIVMCLYFYKYRRLWPLVIAHYLYDGIQMAMFIASL